MPSTAVKHRSTAPLAAQSHESPLESATIISRRNGPTALALRTGFWRILHPSGAILGYIERSHEPDGEHFNARRLIAGTTRIAALGEFWTMESALDCFSY